MNSLENRGDPDDKKFIDIEKRIDKIEKESFYTRLLQAIYYSFRLIIIFFKEL